jgi:hypothetical protein
MDLRDSARRTGPSPYRGIIWAFIFILAFLIFALALRQKAGEWQPRVPQNNAEDAEEKKPPREPRVGAELETEDGPRRKELPAYLTNSETLEHVVESESLDTYPFYYILYQAKIAGPDALRERAQPLPPTEQLDGLRAGAPVSIEGTVAAYRERTELCIPDADIPYAVQHEIRCPDGRIVLAFTVQRVRGVAEGDRVTLVGRYLRTFPHVPTTAPKDAEEQPAPVVIARRVDAPQLLDDPSVLKDVKDGSFSLEAKPYYYLLHRVESLSQAELKKRADPEITEETIERATAQCRGRFVAIEGKLILTDQRDEPPNIAHIDRTYRCIIRTRNNRWFWIYTLEDPRRFARRDVVKGYGLFFKSYRFTSAAGYERLAYVLFARRLVEVQYEAPTHLTPVLLVLGAVTFLGLLIAVLLETRRRRQMDEHVRQLGARTRPRDLDQTARAAAARTRKERAGEKAGPSPPDVE